MRPTAKVDKTRFDMLVIQLQKVTGMRYKDIIRAQAKQMLNHALKKCRTASKSKMVKSFYPINVMYGKDMGGKEWHTDKSDFKWFDMTWRLNDARWKSVLKYSKESILLRYKLRGLTKGQFWLMGSAVGIDVVAPDYVIKSTAPIANRARGKESREGGKYGYSLMMRTDGVKANASGYAQWALRGAFKARGNHYTKAVEKGIFADVKKTRKQFGLG